MTILSTRNITKNYPAKAGTAAVEVLKGVDLEIRSGSITAIVGASGSGKSTLMHVLGGLDKPSTGEVYFNDQNIAGFTDEQLSKFRNREIGFVFQFHHLLPEFSALENVMMPALIRNLTAKEVTSKATQLLSQFGLSDRLDHRPSMLSGGEQQRVAMARALMNDPSVLLADEPTGNLDEKNTNDLIDQIIELRSSRNLTIVLVTHDKDIAQRCDHTFTLRNGVIA
ncbi:MAG TPA: lipoprotein-releasing system ATP-binding protein LolD [Bacteroidetes bacterium]|nr:lipoprotein-releasing system ATP-binding protein LolD [Bacteroidota bacterium]